MAGKANQPAEQEYLEQVIRPRLGNDATYIGELDATLKRELYAKAACLLFPVRWPEPFGMVMIEAMACGTPVVALRDGSVPEVIVDGRTGIICDEPADLSACIDKTADLRPADCREHVAHHFDLSTMARGYTGCTASWFVAGNARPCPSCAAALALAKLRNEQGLAPSGRPTDLAMESAPERLPVCGHGRSRWA